MYALRRAGSHLPEPVKAPAHVLWRAWGRFASRSYGRYYYTKANQTWDNTFWLGVPICKNPKDLWIYQEIMFEVRPDLIIETGSYRGGSALYFASMFGVLGIDGKVVSVDISPPTKRPQDPRIEYVTGSSTSDEAVALLRERAAAATCVMVVLDSDHRYAHVIEEMRLLHDLVTVGSYMIVEDTNINGHPVNPSFGPGPWEAVDTFLEENHDFIVDESREKFMHTFNPRGFLKRVR